MVPYRVQKLLTFCLGRSSIDMYRDDLSPLKFSPWNRPSRLSVGWLDEDHSFSRGEVSTDTLDRLFELCQNPSLKTRGFHECPFCPKQGSGRQCSRNGKSIWLGSGMIRIRGNHGKRYSAPDLIYHYMADHNYLPPKEFIQAVVRPRNWIQRKLDWYVFNSQ